MATVTNVYITAGHKGGGQHYAIVEDRSTRKMRYPPLLIPPFYYQQLKGRSATARICVKNGLLGYKWISKWEIAEIKD